MSLAESTPTRARLPNGVVLQLQMLGVSTAVLGVFLGLVGTDVTTGMQRYTLGVDALFDGIGFVPLPRASFVPRRDRLSSRGSGRCGRRGRSR